MSLNKLIIVGILLMSVGSVMAWTDETAPLDNETLNIGFNPILDGESTANNPYPFGMYPELMDESLLMSSYLSNDPLTVCTSYMLYKQVWNGSAYEQVTTCNISIDTCVDLIYNPSTDTYELPNNWDQVTSNGFLVSRYFQQLINSDSEFCSQWNSTDEPFPDVFYTFIDVDVEDGVEHTAYMYTSLDDDDIESLSDEDVDYGFALDGRGSGGSSGSIYEGVDMYGASGGDGSGMGGSFNTIFWCIIPLIFILSIMKLSSRVLK